MHGLIFMTWEKYLGDRFGKRFLDAYRNAIGETAANLPLANRLYDDETLLVGVGAASRLASMLPEALLREYGRYFIINGLTGHLCLYILAQVHNGCDLLLTMRNAHARLRTTLEGLQPPLFEYEPSSFPNEVILRYDSPRKLCDVLLGAIEGSAERFGETVQVQEHACMKTGAPFCRISARFFAPKDDLDRYRRGAIDTSQRRIHAPLLDLVWDALPDAGRSEGIRLSELQGSLQRRHRVPAYHLRPAILLEALHQLQFAGYVMSTAHQPRDNFMDRRYWRVNKHL